VGKGTARILREASLGGGGVNEGGRRKTFERKMIAILEKACLQRVYRTLQAPLGRFSFCSISLISKRRFPSGRLLSIGRVPPIGWAKGGVFKGRTRGYSVQGRRPLTGGFATVGASSGKGGQHHCRIHTEWSWPKDNLK